MFDLTNPLGSFADLCANFVLLPSMVRSGFINLLHASYKVLQYSESRETKGLNTEYTNTAEYLLDARFTRFMVPTQGYQAFLPRSENFA